MQKQSAADLQAAASAAELSKLEEWRNGGMEEWRNGGMEEWRLGEKAGGTEAPWQKVWQAASRVVLAACGSLWKGDAREPQGAPVSAKGQPGGGGLGEGPGPGDDRPRSRRAPPGACRICIKIHETQENLMFP